MFTRRHCIKCCQSEFANHFPVHRHPPEIFYAGCDAAGSLKVAAAELLVSLVRRIFL